MQQDQDQNLLQQDHFQNEQPELNLKTSNHSFIPEKFRKFFKGYQHTLSAMAEDNKERQSQLSRIQQYYEKRIAQLEERIETLEYLLEKSQQKLRQKLSRSNLSPESNKTQRKSKHEAFTPVTIDFRHQDEEEQSLLDDLETEHKHKPTPKLVQSIIFECIQETNTTKKHTRRTSIHQSIKPSRFLKEQFDAVAIESVKDMKEDPFQAQLKIVKQELANLRACLVDEGVDPDGIGQNKIFPDQVCVRLIQMEESRHVKEHLTNENNQLRKRANIYVSKLKDIGPELICLKKLLLAAIEN